MKSHGNDHYEVVEEAESDEGNAVDAEHCIKKIKTLVPSVLCRLNCFGSTVFKKNQNRF